MKRYSLASLGLLSLVSVLLCLGCGCQTASQSPQSFSSKIIRIKGQARVSSDGGQTWQRARMGDQFEPGVTIQTAAEPGAFLDVVLGEFTQPSARGSEVAYPERSHLMVARLYRESILRIDQLGRNNVGAGRPRIELSLAAGKMAGGLNLPPAHIPCDLKVTFVQGEAQTPGARFNLTAAGELEVMRGAVAITTAKDLMQTKRVHAGEHFDPATGLITKLPKEMPTTVTLSEPSLETVPPERAQ